MNALPPQAERTLVVMLGGSTYPHHPGFDNLRFKQSAEDLRAYFRDPTAFNLPGANLLWLFDSKLNPGDLNDQIETFLSSTKNRPEDQQPLDVIIIFIGHGFFDDDKTQRILSEVSPQYLAGWRKLKHRAGRARRAL